MVCSSELEVMYLHSLFTEVRENGVFSAVVNGGVEDSVMGSGLP